MQNQLIEQQLIHPKIHEIRGQKVRFDFDLASLHGVETKALNQAAKRNIERFSLDFMFQLSPAERQNLKSQFVISSWGRTRKLPLAFIEQGVAMHSSVLRRKKRLTSTSRSCEPS